MQLMVPESRREKIGGVELDYSYLDTKDVYNEGDDEENLVLETLKNGTDPMEVLLKDKRWPVLYQLSPKRKTIVAPMDLRETDQVLEIGAGMGACTGAIAQRVAHVDCIDLSHRRCLANAYRNQAYDNIRIYAGNFENIRLEKQYDVVVLIGVLEYSGFYIHDAADPYAAFLERIHGLLKPGGRLYIAIENRLGMKYFAGAIEDHLGAPFVGIEGYPGEKKVCTFSRQELIALLERSGYLTPYFFYPYPDYKLPSVIFSDDMLSWDSIPPMYALDAPRIRLIDEQLALRSLRGKDELKVFSNSFLVEAMKA